MKMEMWICRITGPGHWTDFINNYILDILDRSQKYISRDQPFTGCLEQQ